MSRSFNEPGVFHFVSDSFTPLAVRAEDAPLPQPSSGLLNRISTVIVDNITDRLPITVDAKGFHPLNATVKKVRASSVINGGSYALHPSTANNYMI
jgi:hypothetical protein